MFVVVHNALKLSKLLSGSGPEPQELLINLFRYKLIAKSQRKKKIRDANCLISTGTENTNDSNNNNNNNNNNDYSNNNNNINNGVNNSNNNYDNNNDHINI